MEAYTWLYHHTCFEHLSWFVALTTHVSPIGWYKVVLIKPESDIFVRQIPSSLGKGHYIHVSNIYTRRVHYRAANRKWLVEGASIEISMA
jgi:hypothetical protein